jgi:hypothetical protein
MSSVLKTMLDRRNELRNELSAFPEFREYELLEGFIRQYESITGTEQRESVKAERPQRTRRAGRLTVTDAAARAIEDAGCPVPLQDLTETLPKYGKTVRGKRPTINLSSALSRDKRFQSVHWRGTNAWWFRDRELPSEAHASGGGAAGTSAAGSEDAGMMEASLAAA